MTATGTKQRPWTDAEDALMRMLYKQIAASELGEMLGRTKSAVKNRAQVLKISAPGENNGSFRKGHATWNKGKKGLCFPGSVATQFKKGIIPKNRREVGDIRINSEGRLDIKVAPGKQQWVQLSHYNWKQKYGSYPHKDMALAYIDKNPHNCAVENLELVTRAELMRRNSYHNYGKEIAQIVQLRGALARKINNIKKQAPSSPSATLRPSRASPFTSPERSRRATPKKGLTA